MSNILIVYASKNKTTETCAMLLSEKLQGVHTADLLKQKPDITDYDTVIIGSSIQFNLIHEKCTIFLRDNLSMLMKKRTAIFICCGFIEKANQYLLHNFPKKLLNKSESIECFGGAFNVKPLNFTDKYVIKLAKKTYKDEKKDFPEIDINSIEKMAKQILDV